MRVRKQFPVAEQRQVWSRGPPARRLAAKSAEPEPAAPAGALEPANPVTGESSQEIWHRWSLERAERERGERLREAAASRAQTERGIYPVEIAREVAQTHADGACPEWRYFRDMARGQYARILREQPEMRQRDVQAREKILGALFEALPMHLRGALSELRTVMELVGMARECTTFLLGFEIGREAGHRLALRDPRVMLAPTGARKRLAQAREDRLLTAGRQPRTHGPLRLHDGTEQEARS